LFQEVLKKEIDLKLSPATILIHIANFTKNGAVKPGAIMDTADAPGDACVPIGIPTIQRISIIQVNGITQGLFR
jgi:hypothetical protein